MGEVSALSGKLLRKDVVHQSSRCHYKIVAEQYMRVSTKIQ